MADAGQESSEGISVSKPVARVMMLVNAAVWGSGYTMLKHVQENMPTQWMMFFRMASAVLLIFGSLPLSSILISPFIE